MVKRSTCSSIFNVGWKSFPEADWRTIVTSSAALSVADTVQLTLAYASSDSVSLVMLLGQTITGGQGSEYYDDDQNIKNRHTLC